VEYTLKNLNYYLRIFIEENKLLDEQRIKIIDLVNNAYKLGYSAGKLESKILFEIEDE